MYYTIHGLFKPIIDASDLYTPFQPQVIGGLSCIANKYVAYPCRDLFIHKHFHIELFESMQHPMF